MFVHPPKTPPAAGFVGVGGPGGDGGGLGWGGPG
jgi:hypothetical protein